jgi:hypothetical protein
MTKLNLAILFVSGLTLVTGPAGAIGSINKAQVFEHAIDRKIGSKNKPPQIAEYAIGRKIGSKNKPPMFT